MTPRKPAHAHLTDLDVAVIQHTGTNASHSDTETHTLGQLAAATSGQQIGGAEIAGQQLARDRTLTGPILP